MLINSSNDSKSGRTVTSSDRSQAIEGVIEQILPHLAEERKVEKKREDLALKNFLLQAEEQLKSKQTVASSDVICTDSQVARLAIEEQPKPEPSKELDPGSSAFMMTPF
jgi:putative aminopeptidase FrvX